MKKKPKKICYEEKPLTPGAERLSHPEAKEKSRTTKSNLVVSIVYWCPECQIEFEESV